MCALRAAGDDESPARHLRFEPSLVDLLVEPACVVELAPVIRRLDCRNLTSSALLGGLELCVHAFDRIGGPDAARTAVEDREDTNVDDQERAIRLEASASLFQSAADELDLAGAHSRLAAEHFRAGEIPRGTAHAWAALGHLRTGEDRLMVQAREHRERSSL